MSTIKEIEVLKDNTEVTVKMNTFLYHRLHKMITNYLPFKDLEELGKVVEIIKSNKPHPDQLSYHTETILLIMNLIEEAAKEQGLTRRAKVDMDTGEEVK